MQNADPGSFEKEPRGQIRHSTIPFWWANTYEPGSHLTEVALRGVAPTAMEKRANEIPIRDIRLDSPKPTLDERRVMVVVVVFLGFVWLFRMAA